MKKPFKVTQTRTFYVEAHDANEAIAEIESDNLGKYEPEFEDCEAEEVDADDGSDEAYEARRDAEFDD